MFFLPVSVKPLNHEEGVVSGQQDKTNKIKMFLFGCGHIVVAFLIAVLSLSFVKLFLLGFFILCLLLFLFMLLFSSELLFPSYIHLWGQHLGCSFLFGLSLGFAVVFVGI